MLRPHIVILGAGFGGMYVARRLASQVKKGKIDVTVVNRTNYFLFTPLLHEVATGGLSPGSVAEPLREVFAKTGIRIVQASIESIDASSQKISMKSHLGGCQISYDHLVIATGAETNHYGIEGAEEYTMQLKSLHDAYLIRNKIIDLFEQAVLESDSKRRREILSFVVVGGGATGVEVAAELSEFISGMVKRYYKDTKGSDEDGSRPDNSKLCKPEEPTVTLIHAGKELLEQFSPSLRKSAAKRLIKNKISLKLDCIVKSVTRESLNITDGSVVNASMIIWAAGVKPIVPHFEGLSPALAGGGRLAVDEYFRLLRQDKIFALGDTAAYVDVDSVTIQEGGNKTRPLPMLAQVAVGQSKIVANNILAALMDKPLKRFHYHSKGSMVSVGQWFAIGEIFSLNIAGKITWWLWRTVYLFKFASWSKRIHIIFEWTLAIFYPRDITKLT